MSAPRSKGLRRYLVRLESAIPWQRSDRSLKLNVGIETVSASYGVRVPTGRRLDLFALMEGGNLGRGI